MGNKIIELTRGISLGGKFYKKIELREAALEDMIAAEEIVSSSHFIAWRTEIIAACIVKVEGYEGIVTSEVLKRISPVDYSRLNNGLAELSAEGEA